MDVNTEFELIPYSGIITVTFGMSPAQVASALGAPDDVAQNHLGQRVEYRSFMNIGYSAEDTLVNHIGFGRQMVGVKYKGAKIFVGSTLATLQTLIAEDGSPYIYLGFIVLMKLGFTLTGFHDNDRSQLALTMFPRGAWDARIPKLKPFQIRLLLSQKSSAHSLRDRGSGATRKVASHEDNPCPKNKGCTTWLPFLLKGASASWPRAHGGPKRGALTSPSRESPAHAAVRVRWSTISRHPIGRFSGRQHLVDGWRDLSVGRVQAPIVVVRRQKGGGIALGSVTAVVSPLHPVGLR
jgi:hypothetical protein